MIPLTRDLIRAVASEEAACASADLNGVLGMATGTAEKLARRRAITRLLRETDCEPRELARLWGCDPCVVFRARHIETPPQSGYDAGTALRLQWAHGAVRAGAILNGVDTATDRDIAAWRALGARP